MNMTCFFNMSMPLEVSSRFFLLLSPPKANHKDGLVNNPWKHHEHPSSPHQKTTSTHPNLKPKTHQTKPPPVPPPNQPTKPTHQTNPTSNPKPLARLARCLKASKKGKKHQLFERKHQNKTPAVSGPTPGGHLILHLNKQNDRPISLTKPQTHLPGAPNLPAGEHHLDHRRPTGRREQL